MRLLLTIAVIGAAFFVGAVMLSSELGGEVVTLQTEDEEGRLHETSLWIVDYEGRPWLRAGSSDSAWYRRVLENREITLIRAGQEERYRAVPVPQKTREINGLMARDYGLADQIVGMIRSDKSVAIRLDPPVALLPFLGDVPETEPETGAELAAESEGEAELETAGELEGAVETEMETAAELEGESQTEAGTGTGSETAPDADGDAEAAPESDAPDPGSDPATGTPAGAEGTPAGAEGTPAGAEGTPEEAAIEPEPAAARPAEPESDESADPEPEPDESADPEPEPDESADPEPVDPAP